ncbi:hypothetical protein ACFPM0_00750 [Pseudonocardia sulfidoxydans]|uniref:hypothetical protein n=1 Tax=Pseudonocardia sulfidoxydans TaxID=54011 RepID=UPI00360DA5D3
MIGGNLTADFRAADSSAVARERSAATSLLSTGRFVAVRLRAVVPRAGQGSSVARSSPV